MILPRTTLFHAPPSTLTTSQTSAQQAQQTSSAESGSWSFTTSLPISYRVAIFLDASILLLTVAILLGAVLYLRNQKRKHLSHLLPQNRNHNLSPDPKSKIKINIRGGGRYGGRDEEQTLLSLRDGEGGTGVGYFDERKRSVPQMGELFKVGGETGRVVASIIVRANGEKKGKKKGHVRWTDSVQGGEDFEIGEGGNGDVKMIGDMGKVAAERKGAGRPKGY